MLKNLAPWFRENTVFEYIPYKSHISENCIKTKDGDFVTCIKLNGLAHESLCEEDIDYHHQKINSLLLNLASDKLAVWSTTVRKKTTANLTSHYEKSFSKKLDEKYSETLNSSNFYVNELYITLVFRPDTNISKKIKKLDKASSNFVRTKNNNALEFLDDVSRTVLTALSDYMPKRLSTYIQNDVVFSEILEFFDYLINLNSVRRALPKQDLSNSLPRNRTLFGTETFESRGVSNSKFGAVLAIKEYPELAESGFLNVFLSAPFEFILTQSFNFLSKNAASMKIKLRKNQLKNTGDDAESQINALHDALDDLASGRIVFGEHHLTLSVLADDLLSLKNNLSSAHSELSDLGIVVCREDWALESAFWSQLPCNFKFRPRPSLISSLNFAAFCGLHNYPQGRKHSNQWGEAVTLLKGSSNNPYYFNFHLPSSGKEDEKVSGNTLIIGATGSGKTVLQGFLLSQSEKYNPTQIIFDKDRGLEIYVRASNGSYWDLRVGKRTGFNPLQLDNTPPNVSFLNDWVKKLIGGVLTAQEELQIKFAIDGVLQLRYENRRLSRLLDFLDNTSENGVYTKLLKWCNDGELAWVFDNPFDELNLDNQLMGFDVTEFLDNEKIRTPVVMYLFHRVEKLLDGRRLQMFLDEFWKLLKDDYFEDFAENKQKVIRKQNGMMIYGTQSPKDVIKSKIAYTLIEQCATSIFLPNPKATEEDYIDGLKLSKAEFQIIKNLEPRSRQFLIKQDNRSVVAGLDLTGFNDELAVISGTTENVILLDSIRQEVGDDVEKWMPIFQKRRIQ